MHGGVTALAFDNLLGMALFLQGVGAVFTAYLKVYNNKRAPTSQPANSKTKVLMVFVTPHERFL